MVHIAGTLPKGDANGLEAHSKTLAKSLASEQKYFAVGVVVTDSVKTKAKDLTPDPTIAFTRIELITLDDLVLEALAADLLQKAADRRRGGPGQQSFNLSDDGPVERETLALDAGPGYYFQVRDLPAGRFGLYLCTQHVEGVKKHGNLQRSELGEIEPGDYQLHELPKALQSLAELLVEEWETNTGTSVVADDDVIDAEVVEDELEDAAEEAADNDDGEEEE